MIPIERNYIHVEKQAGPIQFTWDDSAPQKSYIGDHPKLMHQISEISRRGKVGITAGIVEWIAWRFSKHSEAQILFQVAEAMWASTVDWRYIAPLNAPERNLDWVNWKGSVRGPICAAYHLIDTLMNNARRAKATENRAVPLSNLTEYVLPNPARFKEWRRVVIERLAKAHPWTQEEPLGAPVPPESVDPEFDYTPDKGAPLVASYIKALDYRQNLFLQPPEQMIKEGFEGEPYP